MAKQQSKWDEFNAWSAEYHKSMVRWRYLRRFGGTDPFHKDGSNMDLVRNHCIYESTKAKEAFKAAEPRGVCIKFAIPPEVPRDYVAPPRRAWWAEKEREDREFCEEQQRQIRVSQRGSQISLFDLAR